VFSVVKVRSMAAGMLQVTDVVLMTRFGLWAQFWGELLKACVVHEASARGRIYDTMQWDDAQCPPYPGPVPCDLVPTQIWCPGDRWPW
jgi:hypothetical protein